MYHVYVMLLMATRVSSLSLQHLEPQHIPISARPLPTAAYLKTADKKYVKIKPFQNNADPQGPPLFYIISHLNAEHDNNQQPPGDFFLDLHDNDGMIMKRVKAEQTATNANSHVVGDNNKSDSASEHETERTQHTHESEHAPRTHRQHTPALRTPHTLTSHEFLTHDNNDGTYKQYYPFPETQTKKTTKKHYYPKMKLVDIGDDKHRTVPVGTQHWISSTPVQHEPQCKNYRLSLVFN